jgi:hypothetical protein
MGRTTVVPQALSRAGITPTYNAATDTDGDGFSNDGRTFIQVLNTNGATRTLTIAIPVTVDGCAVAGKALTIPATTGNKYIGPFPPDIYNQSNGQVYLNWSAVADVTFAVVRM